MARYEILDPEKHKEVRILTRAGATFGDNVNLIGVVPREFGRLVTAFPIFLSKNSQTGQFEPGALLGFSSQENLFLAGDRWDAAYVPLQIQRQPFSVQTADDGAGLAITLDVESPRISTTHGEALFAADGAASVYLQRITSVLHELVHGAAAAQAYAAELTRLHLIEPVRLEVEFVDRSKSQLEGLYGIRREGLAALSPADLARLRDAGFLELIYMQLASLGQVSGLVARKNRLISGMDVA